MFRIRKRKEPSDDGGPNKLITKYTNLTQNLFDYFKILLI